MTTGDTIRNLRGETAVILEANPSIPHYKVSKDGRTVNIWNEKEWKVIKSAPKLTEVQQVLSKDPDALNEFVKYFLRIEVSCSPSTVDQLVSELSGVSSVTEVDAIDYIRVVTDRSHGAKFDIFVSDTIPGSLAERLGVFFHGDGLRARQGEFQINSRCLAEYLMTNHNVLPVCGRAD